MAVILQWDYDFLPKLLHKEKCRISPGSFGLFLIKKQLISQGFVLSSFQQKHAGIVDTVQLEKRTGGPKNSLLLLQDKNIPHNGKSRLIWITVLSNVLLSDER